MKYTILTLIIAFGALLSSAQQAPKRVLETVDKATISEEIKSGAVLIIDVRTPEEFAKGHIKGAVNINYYAADFIAEINKINRNQKVIVYCTVGGRSGGALKKMDVMGFNYVLNLKGGYDAWSANK